VQILAFIVLVLVIGALLSIDKETLEPKLKWSIAGAILGLVLVGMVYQHNTTSTQQENREKINHFSQGGSLTCKGIVVDNARFSYENGTASFVAKKGIQEIRGVIVPLRDCEVEGK